jgi:Tfp pilus assembly protein PilF
MEPACTAMQEVSAAQAIALFHQSAEQLLQQDFAAAGQSLRQALALDPLLAEAHANLGYVCDLLGDTAQAEGHFHRAIALAPGNATVHLNLGALLALQKRHAEAQACYAAALALEPQSSAVWSNLGAHYLALKDDDRADACLRQAMALDPDNRKPRFNLAYLQLRLGQFEEGWALFEARDWYRAMEQRFAFARWQGEDLAGKALLVCFEAGHGDVIQFCRYIPLLKARGARHITLLCHPALQALMRSLAGLDAVCTFDAPLAGADSAFDYWLPLLSAPYQLGTRLDSVPATLPYLQAEPARMAHWSPHLPAPTARRVGLVWKGNPLFENDAERSLPHLRTLAPLWQVPGLQFVALQKGAGEGEAAACAMQQPLTDLGPGMRDFADAAAIVSQLDLLVTVDTAMAHLAGALGRPCWLLLPWCMTDWRWGAAGAASVWYPQVLRLFRQGPDADWAAVVAQVTLALLEPSMPRPAPLD